MCVIFYWGCRFDSFLLLLVSVPYYIQTLSAPSPCSPCHLSLLACRSLCIIVRALDICVRPPFSAFCTHITLRRRSKRFRHFKRWVWSPCGTHEALTRPTGRQRSPSCGTHFFFAMLHHIHPRTSTIPIPKPTNLPPRTPTAHLRCPACFPPHARLRHHHRILRGPPSPLDRMREARYRGTRRTNLRRGLTGYPLHSSLNVTTKKSGCPQSKQAGL
jgi:hypothetical protein